MSGSQASEKNNQQTLASAHDDAQHDLSKRELQIVELVAAGLTNQEISENLQISKRTVDNHVSNVLNKTATGNRVALVRWALQSGKVALDGPAATIITGRNLDMRQHAAVMAGADIALGDTTVKGRSYAA